MNVNIYKDMIDAINQTKKGTSGYDTTANVIRIEDGIAWVHIPGGVEETPVRLSVNASTGDTVRVRVAGGQAWITGNDSAPPTDDATANAARYEAGEAQKAAAELAEYIATHISVRDDGMYITMDGSGYKLKLTSEGAYILDPEGKVVATHSLETIIGQTDGHSHIRIAADRISAIDAASVPYYTVGDLYGQELTVIYQGNGSADMFWIEDGLEVLDVDAGGEDISWWFHRAGEADYATEHAGQDETGLPVEDPYIEQYQYESYVFFPYTKPESNTNITITIRVSDRLPYFSFGTDREDLSHIGPYSAVFGRFARAPASGAFASGYAAAADGAYSHAQNIGTIAAGTGQTAIGKYNVEDTQNRYALIIGNGWEASGYIQGGEHRSNALAVAWDGNIVIFHNNRGLYVQDGEGNDVPLIKNDPENNIRIGHENEDSEHFEGKTYISSGYSSTGGNESIYVSVPNATNTGADDYQVWHAGNLTELTNTELAAILV